MSLLDAGNTVPFITRYRKDQTGGLDEEQIRAIEQAVSLARLLAERKTTILRSIESQGKLTPELEAQIRASESTKALEDLYLPYKPKKQTLATTARERGLEPLAREILDADRAAANLDARANDFVNPDHRIKTPAEALLGAGHILAEWFSERADLRQRLREILLRTGALTSARIESTRTEPAKLEPAKPEPVDAEAPKTEPALGADLAVDAAPTTEREEPPASPPPAAAAPAKKIDPKREKLIHQFRDYFDYREPVERIPPHRVLAINRGERAKILKVKVEFDQAACAQVADELLVPADHPHAEFLRGCTRDALDRLILPSLERELRREQTEYAEDHAVGVFARNLRSLLLQPPVRGKRVLAIDPGYKSGCKIAALDEFGNLLGNDVVHVIGKVQQREAAKTRLDEFIKTHNLSVIAIGNGSACRQTEELVAEVLSGALKETGVAYTIVNEAGASVYSASPLGREEFPQHDATLRGTISIGRRLQDPLSELVKIEPANIGVGMYQHDVKAKHLRDMLDSVVSSCVNYVGVDLNTASPALLRYVSGLNQLTARRLYDYRREHGPFKNRDELKKVPGFGEATFTQAAGFLKIVDGDNPLDATWIHPESYQATARVLEKLGCSQQALADKSTLAELPAKVREVKVDELAREVDVGEHTLDDILSNLSRPGRDPREDLPPPVFKQGILKLEDLQPGMELAGSVLNVVDFGAFVDIGLSDRGLVHVSQMATGFISSPHEVVSVGDVARVWVLGIDKDRRRVSLTMISPEARRERAQQRPPRREAPADQPAGERPKRRRRKPKPQPAAAVATGEQQQAPPQRSGGRRFDRPDRNHDRPRRKPAPPVKLTAAMESGKEPVRSFAELKKLLEIKSQQPPQPGDDKQA